MQVAELNFLAGWFGMLVGVVSGTILGLFFHQENWQGGYGALRRRLIRLGHISFIGLGIINLLFYFSVRAAHASLPTTPVQIASVGLNIGAVTMPLCCFLAAWRPALRRLFAIPVLSEFVGIASFLIGWLRQ